MARSIKKGPYVQDALMTKVSTMNAKNGHKLGEFSPTRLFRGHTGAAKPTDKKAGGVPTTGGDASGKTPARGQAAVK